MLQWLPWQDAAVAAGGATVATLGLGPRRARAARAAATWCRELAVMFTLYALWQVAGDLSVTQGGDAVDRGRDIWRAERWLHVPSERSVQRLVLGHREVVRVLDLYYAQVHVAGLGVCLVWLFARHRDRYPAVRNVLAAVTGASLLIQLLPVAPPRLVPGLGMVDTGHVVGPSVYPATVAPGLDQLSAMPSLHVAWAIIVAGAIIYSLRSPWRWAAAAYPVFTWLVVVATGNHYWADGVVATLLCLAAWVVARWVLRRRSGARRVPLGEAADERLAPDGGTAQGEQVGRPLDAGVPR